MIQKDQYKERLRAFNSTPKYKAEMDFLIRLMQPGRGEKILDYGCGLGTIVNHINSNTDAKCYGYDVRNYWEQDDNSFYYRENYFFKFHKVFFFHSIAHIPNINEKLIALKELLLPDAKVYVITPNSQWLEHNPPPHSYEYDKTVLKHFNQSELITLFRKAGYNVDKMQHGGFGNCIGTTLGCYYVNERLFLEATI